MTISSQIRVNHFNGNASQIVFPFTFKVFRQQDVTVTLTNTTTGADTPQVYGVDFTVALNTDQNSNPGGTITMVAAPSSTSRITITSDIDYLQPTDITNGGGFYPEVITDSLDRLTILTQQLNQEVQNALRFPLTDISSSTSLPNSIVRAGQLLGFDSSGNPIAVPSAGSSGAGVTTFNGRNGLVSLLSSDIAATIGFVPNGYEVASIAALRTQTVTGSATGPNHITTAGYYAAGDGGAANYYLDTADTSTADNGGTVIVTTDGRRFKMKITGVVNVKQFGAKGDWNGTTGTDDAPAFQAAINAMSGIPGGTVYVPPVAKAYRWNQTVTLTSFCTLKGSEELRIPNIQAVTFNEYYGGHCIAITWGAGTTSGQALTQVFDSYIHGLVFLYPGQVTSLTAPTPIIFPPTIGGVEGAMPGGSINCCYFVNSYKAIYFVQGHGELKIRSCWGAILGDFITLSGSFNADQIEDLNASGIFYLLGSPDANFTNNSGLWAWVQRNGRAIVLGNADAIRISNSFIGNCFIGMAFAAAPVTGGEVGVSQYSYGDWVGGGMEGVTYPFYVSGSTTSGISSNGFRVCDAGIAPVGLFSAARSVALVMLQPTTTFADASEQRGKFTFDGCIFWGAGTWVPNVGTLEGIVDATGGDIDFIGCTIKVQQSYVARAFSGTPVIKFIGCTSLNTAESVGSFHFAANAATSGKILHANCEWRGGLRVYNASSTAVIAETTLPTTPSIAATSSLDIPYEGNFFSISGTSGTINSIPNMWPGRSVTLYFPSAGLVISGTGNVALTNGAFTAVAGSSITLRAVGANYVEVSRAPVAGSGGSGVPATAVPPVIAATGVVGTSLAYARQDHTHGTQAASVIPFSPPTGMTSTNVQAAISEVYADIGTGGGGAAPFNGTPTSIQASGSPGSSTLYARGDHQHAASASNVSVSPPSGYSSTNVQGAITETASYISTLNSTKAGVSGDLSVDFNARSYNLLKIYGSGTAGGTTGANSLTIVGNNAGAGLPASSNTAIGCNALMNATSVSNATALGTNSLLGVNSQGYGNVTGLGAGTQVTGSDQLQLGSSSTTSYAYGTVQNRSDVRDKAAIRDTVLGLDFINALHPVDFKWDYREDYVDYSTYPVMPIAPEMPNLEGYTDEQVAQIQQAFDQAVAKHKEDFSAYLVECDTWRSTNDMDKIERDGSKVRSRFHHGLIAQEVQALIAASGVDFGGFQNHALKGGMDVMSIGYEELIAPLIKAVQQLTARVAELEGK